MGSRTRKHFLFSLADQGIVSGGNFLTIALGAALLPIGEQGKLVYIYSAYIALVLLNISAFFSAANIVRNEADAEERYKSLLLGYQIGSSILTTLLIAATLVIFQEQLGWQVTAQDLVLLSAFLVSQQIADFYRRSGYVYGRIESVALQSLWFYGARIAGVLYLQPATVLEFLLIMTLPALPAVLLALGEIARHRARFIHDGKNLDIIRLHFNLSKWNILGTPFRWAGLHLPIILVGALHSLEAVAILGTIRAITTFANVLLELLETFVPAWLSSKHRESEETLADASFRIFYVGIFVWTVGALAIWLAGEKAIDLILGPEYVSYSSLLLILWASNGVYFSAKIIGLYYRLRKNTRIEFLGLAIGMISLLLATPLIILYGAWGGAWCLVIVQAVTLAGLLARKPT